jgi:hypothetical protein
MSVSNSREEAIGASLTLTSKVRRLIPKRLDCRPPRGHLAGPQGPTSMKRDPGPRPTLGDLTASHAVGAACTTKAVCIIRRSPAQCPFRAMCYGSVPAARPAAAPTPDQAKPTLAEQATRKDFEFHPLADIFPLFEGSAFKAFIEDIGAIGQ